MADPRSAPAAHSAPGARSDAAAAGGLPAVPDLAAVRAAAERIAPWIQRTPVLTSEALDELVGGELFFKCESFQRTGAFKFRGASNAVRSLTEEEARRGVITHSSGNHGAALALAARLRGIPAVVVMPEGAAAVKRAAVESYGARVETCAGTETARVETAERLARESGAAVIHPFDDPRVIAGQGTAALELLEEIPGLDLLVAPVGGGGLLSGTAIAAGSIADREIEVVGAEPAAVDDAARSLAAGRLLPQDAPGSSTIADGLRTGLSPRTFAVIRSRVARILTVEERAIVDAMRTAWERLKAVIEPSAAVPVAVVLGSGVASGRRAGVILSGGNLDLDRLPWQG